MGFPYLRSISLQTKFKLETAGRAMYVFFLLSLSFALDIGDMILEESSRCVIRKALIVT